MLKEKYGETSLKNEDKIDSSIIDVLNKFYRPTYLLKYSTLSDILISIAQDKNYPTAFIQFLFSLNQIQYKRVCTLYLNLNLTEFGEITKRIIIETLKINSTDSMQYSLRSANIASHFLSEFIKLMKNHKDNNEPEKLEDKAYTYLNQNLENLDIENEDLCVKFYVNFILFIENLKINSIIENIVNSILCSNQIDDKKKRNAINDIRYTKIISPLISNWIIEHINKNPNKLKNKDKLLLLTTPSDFLNAKIQNKIILDSSLFKLATSMISATKKYSRQSTNNIALKEENYLTRPRAYTFLTPNPSQKTISFSSSTLRTPTNSESKFKTTQPDFHHLNPNETVEYILKKINNQDETSENISLLAETLLNLSDEKLDLIIDELLKKSGHDSKIRLSLSMFMPYVIDYIFKTEPYDEIKIKKWEKVKTLYNFKEINQNNYVYFKDDIPNFLKKLYEEIRLPLKEKKISFDNHECIKNILTNCSRIFIKSLISFPPSQIAITAKMTYKIPKKYTYHPILYYFEFFAKSIDEALKNAQHNYRSLSETSKYIEICRNFFYICLKLLLSTFNSNFILTEQSYDSIIKDKFPAGSNDKDLKINIFAVFSEINQNEPHSEEKTQKSEVILPSFIDYFCQKIFKISNDFKADWKLDDIAYTWILRSCSNILKLNAIKMQSRNSGIYSQQGPMLLSQPSYNIQPKPILPEGEYAELPPLQRFQN